MQLILISLLGREKKLRDMLHTTGGQGWNFWTILKYFKLYQSITVYHCLSWSMLVIIWLWLSMWIFSINSLSKFLLQFSHLFQKIFKEHGKGVELSSVWPINLWNIILGYIMQSWSISVVYWSVLDYLC